MDGVNEPVEESRPRPPKPARDAAGVDVRLIRWLPDKSYGERLTVLQVEANSLARLRAAAAMR